MASRSLQARVPVRARRKPVSGDRVRPPSRLPSEERREQIVCGAVTFFEEHGFSGTTRELSRALGIAQPLIFKYFANKDALIEAVYERIHLGRISPTWPSLVTDRTRPVRERMRQFYDEYGRAVLTRDFVRLFIFGGLHGAKLPKRYLERLGRTIIAPLHKEIVHEIELRHGAAAPKPTLASMWVQHGGIFYLGVREHVYGLPQDKAIEAEIEASVDRFLSAYAL